MNLGQMWITLGLDEKELQNSAKTLKSFAGNRARKGHFVEPRLKDGKLTAN